MQFVLLVFPSFNLYSMPLLFLVMQALIFAGLLAYKYFKSGVLADLILSVIIVITCFHRTTYTLGFMDWYDTYQNTKINYFLIDFTFALSPLLYLYVKEITQRKQYQAGTGKWFSTNYLHFIPIIIYVAFKLFVYFYDLNQPGFDETQNGAMVIALEWAYINPFVTIFSNLHMLLYLAFSIQLYFNYREKIEHYFSNTFQLELNWLRNFLFLYSLIFLYGIIQMVINNAIVDLHWTQEWWFHFFSALVIVYVAIKGFFTKVEKLSSLDFGESQQGEKSKLYQPNKANLTHKQKDNTSLIVLEKKNLLLQRIEAQKHYLNPDLNLNHLAQDLGWSRAELSEVINTTCGVNFNDFINKYRVAEVKQMLKEGKQSHLSLLGIALDAGFSSKATFNRAFRKLEGMSPSEYMKL